MILASDSDAIARLEASFRGFRWGTSFTDEGTMDEEVKVLMDYETWICERKTRSSDRILLYSLLESEFENDPRGAVRFFFEDWEVFFDDFLAKRLS